MSALRGTSVVVTGGAGATSSSRCSGCPRFVRRLRRHRPVLIDGYAEALNVLAGYLTRHAEGCGWSHTVVSSAQTLPEPARQAIQRILGCRVFDKYGSRAFSGIAWECDAHDGHHVLAESYVVEALRERQPARPGELDEIVITDLNSRCMQFVRYRLGDLAVNLVRE